MRKTKIGLYTKTETSKMFSKFNCNTPGGKPVPFIFIWFMFLPFLFAPGTQ